MMDTQQTIDQLGGTRKLMAMIGVKQIVTSPDSIRFSFKGSARVNRAVITLEPTDTYRIDLYRVGFSKVRHIDARDYVYGDNLKEAFESMTGLRLSL